VITVRIAHAEPGPGRPADTGPRVDPRVPAGARPHGFHVVLADDAGHRALRAWLAQDPDGTPLPSLLDRPSDDIWTTHGIPEELAVRLMGAGGGSVTGVEIHPDQADVEEVTEQTCTARIELSGPSGTRHVTARLDLGLTLAVASGAPVLVADALMDRLAVPAPDGDVLAAFREAGPVRAERELAGFVIDRRTGRVFEVPAGLPGQRPRFEPRNMSFGEGLDRWDLDSLARDPAEEAAAQVRRDYSAAAEGRSAVLSSASAQPRGPALLAQTIFADDYHGATVAFGGEIRAEDVAGQAGLRLEILRMGWRIRADRRVERTVGVAGRQDWSRREIAVTVPEDTDVIRFGITLAGPGRVWLRNPELRRERTPDAGSAGVG
jgi:bifunctional DNase/RNase